MLFSGMSKHVPTQTSCCCCWNCQKCISLHLNVSVALGKLVDQDLDKVILGVLVELLRHIEWLLSDGESLWNWLGGWGLDNKWDWGLHIKCWW